MAGNYHAWDCLNSWYGVVDVDYTPTVQMAVLRFRGVLDMDRLAADYRALPGVTFVGTNDYAFVATPIPGTGSFCGWAEGDTHYYFARYPEPTRYYSSEPGQAPVARGPVSASPAIQTLATRCFEEHTALP